MIKFINLSEQYQYVSPLDTEDEKTIFILRNLKASEKARSLMQFEENAPVDSMFSTIRACLVGVKNGGKDIPVTDELVESIPLEVLNGIYQDILARNILTGDDRKN